MISQCQQCRKEKWRECPEAPEWFSYSEIKFCPHQVRWIISRLFTLEDGRWPVEGSGYIKAYRPQAEGYFVKTKIIVAELNKRLDKCGKDGILTKNILTGVWDYDEIAKEKGTTTTKLERRVRRVVAYCSGWRQKKIEYEEFSRRFGIRESYRRKDDR